MFGASSIEFLGGPAAGPCGGGGELSQADNSQGVAGISRHDKFLPLVPARGGEGVEAVCYVYRF